MRSFLLRVWWFLGITLVGCWPSSKDQAMKVMIHSKSGSLNANLSSEGIGVTRDIGGMRTSEGMPAYRRRSADDRLPIKVPDFDPLYAAKKKQMDLNWVLANRDAGPSSGALPPNDDFADFAEFLREQREKVQSSAKKGSMSGDKVEQPQSLEEDVALMMEEEVGTPKKKRHGKTEPRWKLNSTDSRPVWSSEREYLGDNEEAAASEEDSTEVGDSPDAGDDRHQGADTDEFGVQTSSRTRVVKDKYVQLPEPLYYNQSHLVSSLVYSMIPFRSPLLSLLDPDRHAKYIMIKVDPVLAMSPDYRPGRFEDTATQETKLEQNLIDLIDRSIVNELSPAYNAAPYLRAVDSRIKGKMMKISELAKIMAAYQQMNRAKNNAAASPPLMPTIPRM